MLVVWWRGFAPRGTKWIPVTTRTKQNSPYYRTGTSPRQSQR